MTQHAAAATEYLRTRTIVALVVALVAAVVAPPAGMVMGAMLTYDFRADGPHPGTTARNRRAAQLAAGVGAVLTVPSLFLFTTQIGGMLASLIP